MAARIEEAVGQRVPHFPWRAQHVQVVTVGEHAAAATEGSIHGSRKARANRFHARCEIARAPRLYDRVQMIVLNRIVNEPEAPALARRCEAALELTDELRAAQRRNAAPHLQRDVARKTGGERRTSTPRMTRIQTGLAPGTRASSTPARCFSQIEIELPCPTCRHDLHCDMQV